MKPQFARSRCQKARQQFRMPVSDKGVEAGKENVTMAQLCGARPMPALEDVVCRAIWRFRVSVVEDDLTVTPRKLKRGAEPRNAGSCNEDFHGENMSALRAFVKVTVCA